MPLIHHCAYTDQANSNQVPLSFQMQKNKSNSPEPETSDQSSPLHLDSQELFSYSFKSPFLLNLQSAVIINVPLNFITVTFHLHSYMPTTTTGDKFHHNDGSLHHTKLSHHRLKLLVSKFFAIEQTTSKNFDYATNTSSQEYMIFAPGIRECRSHFRAAPPPWNTFLRMSTWTFTVSHKIKFKKVSGGNIF